MGNESFFFTHFTLLISAYHPLFFNILFQLNSSFPFDGQRSFVVKRFFGPFFIGGSLGGAGQA
jgi:hypothetical protein